MAFDLEIMINKMQFISVAFGEVNSVKFVYSAEIEDHIFVLQRCGQV